MRFHVSEEGVTNGILLSRKIVTFICVPWMELVLPVDSVK